MKKILIPTDFSPTAENALFYAANLAGLFDADIHLLHTYELPRKTGLILSIEKHLVGEAQKKIAEESARAASLSRNSRVSTNVRKGYNDELIESEAKKMGADMIVMGTKGASGLKEVFLGSNTVRAIKQTSLPVMVIPEHAAYRSVEKILLAVDDTFFETPECLKPLKNLLEETEAKLIVLHIKNGTKIPAPTPFEALLTEHFGSDNYEFHEIEKTEIEKAIMGFANHTKADIICMIHHYRNFVDRLFKGSSTYKTAFSTERPLLVLKD